MLVFFSIFVLPMISSSVFEALINFKSKEIVTHGASLEDRWADVQAPASIRAAL